MAQSFLQQTAENVPSLKAVLVTAMPDCLLYDSWVKEDLAWRSEDVAAYFGDLVRANREGLKALGSWSSEMQVTIEAADSLLILREINADFVCTCIFERDAPLGMVRLHMKRLLERVAESLPSFEVERRPRGVRLVEFLNRYAPDPHAVMLRVSLRNGIPLEDLERPERLRDEQVEALEETTRKILGLQTLNI